MYVALILEGMGFRWNKVRGFFRRNNCAEFFQTTQIVHVY